MMLQFFLTKYSVSSKIFQKKRKEKEIQTQNAFHIHVSLKKEQFSS